MSKSKPAKVSKKKSLSFKDMLRSTGSKTLRATSVGRRAVKGAVKLCNAASVGVTAKVGRTNKLSSISLCLTNDSTAPANIELTGTVLFPSEAGFQRLFVAGAQEDPIAIVTVQPNQSLEVDLSTCCMDKSKSSPAESVEYSITDKAPRAQDVEAAFNWLSARRAKAKLPPLPHTSEIKTDSFCLQRDYRSANVEDEPKKNKLPKYSGAKTSLDYVQTVCWDGCLV